MSMLIIAGEPSADQLAAPVYAKLSKLFPNLNITGVGGPAMAEHGFKSLFPMEELSLMGLTEIIPHLPNIFKRIKELEDYVLANNIKLVLTVDTQEFSYHLAKRLAPHGVNCVQLVAPTVWAWRPGRAQKYAKYFKHILSILPFEDEHFKPHGVDVTYVGNPVAQRMAKWQKTAPLAPATPMRIAVLPGSRGGEWRRLLPRFMTAISRIRLRRGRLPIVVPIADTRHREWAKKLSELGGVEIVEGENRWPALQECRVALAASGTANLELAMLGVPMVVGYRVADTTAAIGKHLVKIPYISPVNWVAGKAVVPELVQGACTATALATALRPLIEQDALWHQQAEQLALVRNKLLVKQDPADLICDVLAQYLQV